MASLLLIDDHPGLLPDQVSHVFPAPAHRVEIAHTGAEGLQRVADVRPDVILLDLRLPDQSGLDVLRQLRQIDARIPVVLVTVVRSADAAIEAMRQGAYDYLLKPLDLQKLDRVLGEALKVARLMREPAVVVRTPPDEDQPGEAVVGSCPAMQDVYKAIGRVADQTFPVLITGESGTGKELVARAVHTHSPRHAGPFVAINCGAIPETLLESELFGHEKGSFTGAHAQRKGKVESANGGTLFLDEITEMSLPLQVKLLRFLQEREIERVGGRDVIPIDVRVVAASNQSLEEALRSGRFREDLYYRLSVVTIHLPPLRDRGEDVVLLANAFLRRNSHALKRKARFSPEALEAIVKYPWPGNIRELENKVHRAVIMASGRVIGPADLDLNPSATVDALPTLREARDQSERRLIVNALVRSRGNISRAARTLDISRPTFHDMLTKHSIDAKEFR
jgi:two-component system, NtrC family, response regulator AtoC